MLPSSALLSRRLLAQARSAILQGRLHCAAVAALSKDSPFVTLVVLLIIVGVSVRLLMWWGGSMELPALADMAMTLLAVGIWGSCATFGQFLFGEFAEEDEMAMWFYHKPFFHLTDETHTQGIRLMAMLVRSRLDSGQYWVDTKLDLIA